MARTSNKTRRTSFSTADFCDRFMEACWLGMAVLVPLFFNTRTFRIFEPDKIAVLRSLALLLAAAWLCKRLTRTTQHGEDVPGPRSSSENRRRGFLLPVGLLAAALLVSNVFSIAPRVSLLGSYERQNGTYTQLCMVFTFLAVVCNLRSRTQVQRLLQAIVLASIPVCIIGILQRLSLDPVAWQKDIAQRIPGSMGNPVFLGAYLCMVIPVTVWVGWAAWASSRARVTACATVRVALHAGLLALQLLTFALMGSRGPILGLLAALFFMALLYFAMTAGRRRALLLFACAFAGMILLILFNLPLKAIEQLRNVPALKRYSHMLDPEYRTGRVRALIWEADWQILRPHSPIVYPDGRQDAFHGIRRLVGYGPEALKMVFFRFYPPELALVEKRGVSADRSHNEAWDRLIMQGGLGLLAYFTMFLSLVIHALRRLRLVSTRGEVVQVLAYSLSAGAAASAGLALWRGPGYIPPGFALGMAAGLSLYLLRVVFRRRSLSDARAPGAESALTIVLASALIAHFVESQFGFEVAVTGLYFWLYAALLFAVPPLPPEDPAKAVPQGNEPEINPSALRPTWFGGLVLALVLSTVFFAYTRNPSHSTSAAEIMAHTLAWVSPSPEANGSATVLLVSLTLLLGAAFAAFGPGWRTPACTWRALLPVGAIALAIAGLYALGNATILGEVWQVRSADLANVLKDVAVFGNQVDFFYVLVIGLLLGLAFAVRAPAPPAAGGRTRRWAPLAAILCFVPALILATLTNLRPLHADTAGKIADAFSRVGNHRVAAEVFRRARLEAPWEEIHALRLGSSLIALAGQRKDPVEREKTMLQAERELVRAQQLNPANRDHAMNLGQLYRNWAMFTTDPVTRRARAETASEHYAAAARLSPSQSSIWEAWSLLHLQLLGNPEVALKQLRHSLAVDPYNDWTHRLIGDFYFQKASAGLARDANQALLRLAVHHYDEALRLCPEKNRQRRMEYHLSKARAFNLLGNWPRAVQGCLDALAQDVKPSIWWRINKTLAILHEQNGDRPRALEYAELALSQARGKAAVDDVQQLLDRLRSQEAPPATTGSRAD